MWMESVQEYTMLRGGQPLTWQRSMKKMTKRLGAVGATRLPEWIPRDPHCAWLDTLHDMAANRWLSNKSWLYGSEASVLNTDVMLSMMMTKVTMQEFLLPGSMNKSDADVLVRKNHTRNYHTSVGLTVYHGNKP
ncbi:hypothetical protein T265_06007 [Opisthorchis viverrini]|uniref:Uncharacterized protein n=1 Tax=Opisthorchis viverrini TaxID=6198 RepID=A0A074ZHP5_OPIVI|nr:hypothetical protein T265_06007 [Opisthorchis viverrini]KER26793.1 hypothetical protein T265_06007 [Opisthorchis viverrini]